MKFLLAKLTILCFHFSELYFFDSIAKSMLSFVFNIIDDLNYILVNSHTNSNSNSPNSPQITERNKPACVPITRNDIHSSLRHRRPAVPSIRHPAMARPRIWTRQFSTRSLQIRLNPRIRRHPRPPRNRKNVHRDQNRSYYTQKFVP